MRILTVMTLAIGGLMLFGSPYAHADSHEEIMKKFVGTWDIEDGVSFGTPIPEEHLDGSVTVITRDKITTYDRDKKETYTAKYKLNTKTDPMQIDMVSMMNGKEMKALGIVKFEWLDLDGDNEFQLAYSLKPGERPTEFKSPKGSQILTMELEQDDDDE